MCFFQALRQPDPEPVFADGGRVGYGHRVGAGQDGEEGPGKVQAGFERRRSRQILVKCHRGQRYGRHSRTRRQSSQTGATDEKLKF